MIEQYGGFFEIRVATAVCESRDRKGLYAKVRAGIVKAFTSASDSYEVPASPELLIDTSDIGVGEAAQRILVKLEPEGYRRKSKSTRRKKARQLAAGLFVGRSRMLRGLAAANSSQASQTKAHERQGSRLRNSPPADIACSKGNANRAGSAADR